MSGPPAAAAAAPAPTTPATRCCLDAMICIILDGIRRRDLFEVLFGEEILLPRVVFNEWHGSTETGGVVDGVPALKIVESDPVDTPFVARMHRRFGSVPPRNEGEAHLLAVCKRNPGWLAITEDKQGWEAARDENIGRDYLVTVLAAAAAQGRLNPTEAWKLHVEIEQWRQANSHHGMRFSVMPYYADYRPVFQQVVQSFRKGWIDAGRRDWCEQLATPRLDDALVLRHQARPLKTFRAAPTAGPRCARLPGVRAPWARARPSSPRAVGASPSSRRSGPGLSQERDALRQTGWTTSATPASPNHRTAA